MSYEAAHKQPDGPGDARPTAMSIIKDEQLIDKLQGKVFLITGGSSGIGIETARAIYATGAHVYITARDIKKGQEVADEIAASNPDSKGKIEVLKLELDSLQSVKECAADFQSKSKQLNVLIENAGTSFLLPIRYCLGSAKCMQGSSPASVASDDLRVRPPRRRHGVSRGEDKGRL